MKTYLKLITCVALCGGVVGTTRAQPETAPAHAPLGAEKAFAEFNKIKIQNLQGVPLGRIKDLGIDLINGRVVEVLVVADSSLDIGDKIIAVPPLALKADPANEVYRLDVSAADFKSAPGIDLAQWQAAGRSDRVAATYRLFGQEPYFIEDGLTASTPELRRFATLGYIERSSKITDLPVGNPQGDSFGKVWSMTLDIPKGRILNVIILAPGNFQTKSVVPATALSFNDKRDALLLDETKEEYADEPRYVFTEAANGQDAHAAQEPYKGPHTSVRLEQGSGYRDMDRTVLINRNIRVAKINGRRVEVGTINGRVTLRGWVNTADEKRRIGEVAIAASSLELVDNQIAVGKPVAAQ